MGYFAAFPLASSSDCPLAEMCIFNRAVIQYVFKHYRFSSERLNGTVSDILTTSVRLKNESL